MVRGSLPALLLTPILAHAPAFAASQGPSPEAVNAAIERGVAYLLRSQNRDGSWGVDLNARNEAHMDLRDGSCSLALYTLLKCGLTPDQPAIQRAVAFLTQDVPHHTYSAGIQLHALGALHDPSQKKRLQQLLGILLDLQESSGWDYPRLGRADLSNTQVASLGLRAAQANGLDLPKGIWSDLVQIVLRYQERPVEIPGTNELAKEKRRMAGFTYEPGGAPTAAMTTAGLTILGILNEDPSRVDHRFAADVAEARQLALNWLEQHFSVEGNPGGELAWHFYYLYGLERVGAFTALERIGGHDWYAEGATQLLKEQRPAGGWWSDGRAAWPVVPLTTPNTCFALLFLRKATLSGETRERPTLQRAEGADAQVRVRVDAKRTWTLWVTGFAEAGLSVERVEWWIGGALAGTVAGDPSRPWSDERFPLRYEPQQNGEFPVECRAFVRAADGSTRELRSPILAVRCETLLEPWMLEYARDAAASVFTGAELTLTASSEAEFHPKADLLDGLQGSAWWAKEDDATPWIRLESAKGLRLKELWISPAGASEVLREQCLRFTKLELRLNDAKAPLVITLDPDPRLKTKFVLPKPQLVRTLELRVIDPPHEAGKCVGLAELEGR
jgi:hypothetical protein